MGTDLTFYCAPSCLIGCYRVLRRPIGPSREVHSLYARIFTYATEVRNRLLLYQNRAFVILLKEWQMTPIPTDWSPEQSFTCTLLKPTVLLALGLHQILLQTS